MDAKDAIQTDVAYNWFEISTLISLEFNWHVSSISNCLIVTRNFILAPQHM
jgi:hypothetical protein